MTAPQYDYDAAAVLDDGSEIKLNLEEHGWAEPTRLARVRVWSLIPRDQNGMPVVTIQIPEDAKPIFKSRVYGKGLPAAGGPAFRAYAIGWHDTTSHWTWVMPGGNIEVGEDPLFADIILKKMVGIV